MLRAYDKATGKDAGAVYLPAQSTGGAMTYMVNGVQYIVIAVGGNIGGRNQAQFMAFRFPPPSPGASNVMWALPAAPRLVSALTCHKPLMPSYRQPNLKWSWVQKCRLVAQPTAQHTRHPMALNQNSKQNRPVFSQSRLFRERRLHHRLRGNCRTEKVGGIAVGLASDEPTCMTIASLNASAL